MTNANDRFDEELREIERRADAYISRGLHPAHAKNKAKKDMRKLTKTSGIAAKK